MHVARLRPDLRAPLPDYDRILVNMFREAGPAHQPEPYTLTRLESRPPRFITVGQTVRPRGPPFNAKMT